MGSPQLDWTLADAPQDSAPSETGPQPSRDPARPSRRPPTRRLMIGLLSLAVLLGFGVWLFIYVGWLRIQSQLATQIAYEDQRARAGDVAAVLALQAPGEPAWRDQLTAQVRLGLAAPLPAGDLLPAATAPRLGQVQSLGGDLFSASVTRDYVDTAGKTYAFDLTERFTCPNCGAGAGRNLAPGQWERLPPDASVLSPTMVFQGQRLSVTVPAADLPWLQPALVQADDLIVQACAGWVETCPAGLRLAAAFGAAQSLAAPIITVPRPASGYPRVFDMAASFLPYTFVVHVLPAPLLAGRPHDPAAQAALSRSISVQLLSLFTDKVIGSTLLNDDYFFDALVARAETRYLGAPDAPQTLGPTDYAPLRFLWQLARTPRFDAAWRTDLAWRREAFDFLNFALAGQPPSADGKLLRSLRAQVSANVDDWLAVALGPAASGLADTWTRPIEAEFSNHRVTDWSRYNSLLMACDEGAYLVQGGGARRLLPDLYQGPDRNVYLGEVSPDGRYIVLNYRPPSPLSPSGALEPSWSEVDVMDLVTGMQKPVAAAGRVQVIGWSSLDGLVYWSSSDDLVSAAHARQSFQADLGDVVQLRTYQPATGLHELLMPSPVFADFIFPTAWSADHSALVVTLADQMPGGQFQPSLGVLTFSPAVHVRPLPQPGAVIALSPDASRLAYLSAPLNQGDNRINLLDFATGSIARLAAASDFGLPLDSTRFWDLRWSADGRQVAWSAYSDPGVYLFSASARGPARVWSDRSPRGLLIDGFSPDGRYLVASVIDLQGPFQEFWLLDPQVASPHPSSVGWAYSTTWTPAGHRLVLSGPTGVSALDPDTGNYEWLGPWQNCQLRW